MLLSHFFVDINFRMGIFQLWCESLSGIVNIMWMKWDSDCKKEPSLIDSTCHENLIRKASNHNFLCIAIAFLLFRSVFTEFFSAKKKSSPNILRACKLSVAIHSTNLLFCSLLCFFSLVRVEIHSKTLDAFHFTAWLVSMRKIKIVINTKIKFAVHCEKLLNRRSIFCYNCWSAQCYMTRAQNEDDFFIVTCYKSFNVTLNVRCWYDEKTIHAIASKTIKFNLFLDALLFKF